MQNDDQYVARNDTNDEDNYLQNEPTDVFSVSNIAKVLDGIIVTIEEQDKLLVFNNEAFTNYPESCPNFIIISDKHEVIDLSEDSTLQMTAAEKKKCHKIGSAYRQSHGHLGSDGSGGSINGELTPAACKRICLALQLNSNDRVLDLGSGGGKSLALLVGLSAAKCGVGIECEVIRHSVATNFNKYIMTNLNAFDIPVMFLHDDINNFSDVNGITKVYMFDKAFTTELLYKIIDILNATTSIECIVSTRPFLMEIGLNCDGVQNIGSLASSGGSTHVFYVYKLKHYDVTCNILNPLLRKVFVSVADRESRLTEATDYMNVLHHTDEFLRATAITKILNERKPSRNPSEMLYDELLKVVNINDEATIQDKVYKITSEPTKAYKRFNEQQCTDFCIQMDAVAHKSMKSALIAPSFDGSPDGNGKVLVAIVYKATNSTGTYHGIVYDIDSKAWSKPLVKDLFRTFSHTHSPPRFDITDILVVRGHPNCIYFAMFLSLLSLSNL